MELGKVMVMSDRPEAGKPRTVAVTVHSGPGRSRAKCPDCGRWLDAATSAGVLDEVEDHIDLMHYQPARGNG